MLRGVRGFYGERMPFAERLLKLRRNVPVHVAGGYPDLALATTPTADHYS